MQEENEPQSHTIANVVKTSLVRILMIDCVVTLSDLLWLV
jgi:hypothetical protein